MNRYQQAMAISAARERGNIPTVNSKKRAGTKRASFKASRDGIEQSFLMAMQPVKPSRCVGKYGPRQRIRVWRKSC